MQNKKRKVADVALNLFVEKGIQQTSIQEIIEKANISKGTFYNYFTSKNDCIADILEFLRYDASQQRIAMQLGRDTKDREVFIEQITILLRLNEERNLNTLFEAILHSNESDLKKLVLQHRLIEMEWLSNRLIEMLGEEIREYAFEGTILFYGMVHHMFFSIRITNSPYTLHHVIDVLLSYVELIIEKMTENKSSLLSYSAIDYLRSNVDKKAVSISEIVDLAEQLQKKYPFNQEQQDLFDAIWSEINRERIRKSVLQPLLQPFRQLFINTEAEIEVKIFTNKIWYFTRAINE